MNNRFVTTTALVILCCLSSVHSAGLRSETGRLAVTRRLPSLDRVELQKLSASEMWIRSVEGTKTLEGPEATRVAKLWRSQRFSGMGSSCHFPVYAIKFFHRGQLLAYASLCWDCRNVSFATPNSLPLVGFDARDRKSTR